MITLLVLLCFLNTSFTNDNSYTIKISIRYDCIDNDHILIYNLNSANFQKFVTI